MGEDAETRLIRAALKLIDEFGFAKATTKRIAQEAKVNEVTLFRLFGDKDGLFLRVLHFQADQLIAERLVPTGTIRRDLTLLTESYLSLWMEKGRFFISVFNELMRRPEVNKGNTAPEKLMKHSVQMMLYYQQEGKLRLDHPLKQVAALLGPIILLAMAHRLVTSAHVPTPEAGQLVDDFLALHGREG